MEKTLISQPLQKKLKAFRFGQPLKKRSAIYSAILDFNSGVLHADCGFYRPQLFNARQFVDDLRQMPEFARVTIFYHATAIDVFPMSELLASIAQNVEDADFIHHLVTLLNSFGKDNGTYWMRDHIMHFAHRDITEKVLVLLRIYEDATQPEWLRLLAYTQAERNAGLF